jgi:hypothetical protein
MILALWGVLIFIMRFFVKFHASAGGNNFACVGGDAKCAIPHGLAGGCSGKRNRMVVAGAVLPGSQLVQTQIFMGMQT